jgi:arsenite-transporting ATPase
VPRLADPPIGLAALEGWGEAMRGGLPRLSPDAMPVSSGTAGRDRRASVLELVRPLTIVGGKGGVGKTTVACALGIAASGGRTLVVSTDPAPSVSDALAMDIAEEPVRVPGAATLEAQQLDAAAAFARFRERWQERVDALFAAVLGGRMEAVHDRRIMRDLLRLAPPGIDELYALAALGETLAEERYATVIVDPAPTGHLLRLLESPALALDWSHRLLRLMLKYKPMTGLGEAAEELLAFARRTRALDAILRDGHRAALVLVSLDEPLVRRETERLVGEVRARGMAVSGLVWNRAGAAGTPPLPVTPRVPQFEAPTTTPPPRGVDALTRWMAAWRPLEGPEHG